MRLSEKTIELNFCAQLTRRAKRLVIWFGLTQLQEAEAGFDSCARLGGRLIIFQFKASNYILRSGQRRFYLEHEQLENLQDRVRSFQRSIFYVFPLIGSTLELTKNANLIDQARLLDVARIPPMQPPTTSKGTLRKNGLHYADVDANKVVLHSDPISIELLPASQYAEQGFSGADGINTIFRNFDDFWDFRQYLLPISIAGIII
jgi:hypothetical protein